MKKLTTYKTLLRKDITTLLSFGCGVAFENTTKHHKKGNSNDNAHAEKNAKNAPHAL
ncbi:hypothetical protein [Helicobacter pylori]|uniref:hypothetical protein n=1 Tax=Helicobacter pylori TaxID=210 RepID=UPI00130195C7|nr:hypothetical protein [Helicobacter pylori]